VDLTDSVETFTGLGTTVGATLSSVDLPTPKENPLPTVEFPEDAKENCVLGDSVVIELKIEPPAAEGDDLNDNAADSSFFSFGGNLKVKVCGASAFGSSFFSMSFGISLKGCCWGVTTLFARGIENVAVTAAGAVVFGSAPFFGYSLLELKLIAPNVGVSKPNEGG
jgi:hypothetical protein